MKKISLLVFAVAMSTLLFAVPAQKKVTKVAGEPRISFVEREDAQLDLTPVVKFGKAARVAADSVERDTTWGAYYVANTTEWHTGVPDGGIGYVDYAQIVVPFKDSIVLANAYKPACQWYINDQLVGSDPEYAFAAGQYGGEYDLPVIKTQNFVLKDSNDVVIYESVFKDYQFGALFTSYYADYGFYNSILMAPSWTQGMTQCAMFTEEPGEENDETYGSDWTFVGAKPYGTYSYGTGLNFGTADSVVLMDTIVSIIENDGLMYCDHISVGIYTAGTAVLGADDIVKIDIHPIIDGDIDLDSIIATGIATADDYLPQGKATWYGILNFYFYEADEFGGVEVVPAIIDGDFACVITGINDGEANFGIITDYYTPFDGNTYFYKDGKFKTGWRSPSNLLITFYAVLPGIENLPEQIELNANTETDSTSIILNTNVWGEDMVVVDAPDWVTVNFISDYEIVGEGEEAYEDFHYADTMVLTYEPADANREGELVINALGKIYTVKLIQNQGITGLEDVIANEKISKFVKDGQIYIVKGDKTFDIVGKEVAL